jgi:hypothetical protein
MKIDTCRSCPARIVWCVTAGGKPIPMDADPSSAGTHEIVAASAPSVAPLARFVTTADRPGRSDLHTAHFATCSEPEAWRKGRAA